MNLRVGDRVSYELVDYQVVGKIIFNDHGIQWFEYQLEASDRTIWVSVEMDDELDVSVYEKISMKTTQPVPDEISWQGLRYILDEKGVANVSGQGRSVNLSGQTVKYFDFCDEEDEAYLSVEIWGGDIEVSAGHPADPYDFTIIAGR
ncbi:DUF4178 domain-containing protein [Camelliibacillus cellulosilyticus]|uniref:DUF4178 domain-containing protein n=1 Tax=Camelliibacillus cellulosilyticus TaxID=2174486 RepID=A0ABV9GJ13_9BACL